MSGFQICQLLSMMGDIHGTKYYINRYINSKFLEKQKTLNIEFNLTYPVLDFIAISIKLLLYT